MAHGIPDGLGAADTGGIFPLVASYLPDPRVGGKGNVPEWIPEEVVRAYREDDVDGTGIFDGDRPNMHVGDGIFEDNYSLPGYLARETGLGPSEVIDAQTGTPTDVFFTGLWNRQTGGYVPHRYPVHSGATVPNAKEAADALDLSALHVPRASTWNNPDAGGARPLRPTNVRPARLPMADGRFKTLSGYGSYGSYGEMTMPAVPSVVGWLVAGAAVGMGLAYLYERFVVQAQ